LKATLIRLKYMNDRTLGRLCIFEGLNPIATFTTLEPPWRNNEKNVSCIPTGKYKVRPHVSPSQGKCFKILSVPGRSDILIHVLNFPTQTEGCVGIGYAFSDIDGDGKADITSSRKALNSMLKKVREEFILAIVD